MSSRFGHSVLVRHKFRVTFCSSSAKRSLRKWVSAWWRRSRAWSRRWSFPQHRGPRQKSNIRLQVSVFLCGGRSWVDDFCGWCRFLFRQYLLYACEMIFLLSLPSLQKGMQSYKMKLPVRTRRKPRHASAHGMERTKRSKARRKRWRLEKMTWAQSARSWPKKKRGSWRSRRKWKRRNWCASKLFWDLWIVLVP